ncbi:hypothetical protein ACFL3V_07125 [Nanoarchaeota archaeon]
MMLRLGKKAEIPIYQLILFVIILIVCAIIAFSAFSKSGGLLSNLFSAIRGGGG